MTDPLADLRRDSGSLESGALLVWLLVQWGALAIAAMRVPLAAQWPQPSEFYAIHLLLAVQLGGSAILCPMLCREWRMTLATAACGCVLLLCGAALAGWSLASVLLAMLFLAAWIVTLWLWNGALPGPRARAFIAACAATYAIGGALLWYFRMEGSAGELPTALANGPLQLILDDPQSPPSAAWWCVGIVLASGIAARAAALATNRYRRKLTTAR